MRALTAVNRFSESLTSHKNRRQDVNAILSSVIADSIPSRTHASVCESAAIESLAIDKNALSAIIASYALLRESTAQATSSYRIDPASRGADFHQALSRSAQDHPEGLGVTVHPESYYADPSHRLFLNSDGTTGVGVDRDGYMFSAFAHPGSTSAEIFKVFNEGAIHGTALDCFDIGGRLPTLYGLYGFVPVARVPFDDEYAPKGWPYERMGRPDVVLMAKKAGVTTGRMGNYNKVRDKVPVMTFDDALAAQKAMVARLSREDTSPATQRQQVTR